MPGDDFIPDGDKSLPPYLTNLTTYASANLAALGLVAGDITPISGGASAYQTALNNVTAAQDAYKQALLSKDAAKKTVVNNVRVLARKVQGNAAVTPAQKAALGFNPRTGERVNHKVYTPVNLIATPATDGTNSLKWKPGLNAAGTIYIIEMSYGKTDDWVYVTSVTAKRFVHRKQKPGVLVFYRVTAQRGDQKSEPSNPASVYGPSSSEEVDLRLAA